MILWNLIPNSLRAVSKCLPSKVFRINRIIPLTYCTTTKQAGVFTVSTSVSGLKSVFFCSLCKYTFTQPIIAFMLLSKPVSNLISICSNIAFFFNKQSACLGVELKKTLLKYYQFVLLCKKAYQINKKHAYMIRGSTLSLNCSSKSRTIALH